MTHTISVFKWTNSTLMTVDGVSLWLRRIVALIFVSFLLTNVPVKAQEPSQQTTTTGIVISVTRTTMVIRTDDGRYRLFSISRDTIRPGDIPVGSEVQVISYPSGDPSFRRADRITISKPA